jgi:hypothetical protein
VKEVEVDDSMGITHYLQMLKALYRISNVITALLQLDW